MQYAFTQKATHALVRVIALMFALSVLQACSDSGDSPEEQIRQFVESAVEAGEARSVNGLVELAHQDYRDLRGNNRQRLSDLLRAYFFRHKNIHLFTRIDNIELLGDSQATVNLHVAMAGTVIANVEALASLRARVYHFELQLVKEDEWQLRYVEWMPARIGAFE